MDSQACLEQDLLIGKQILLEKGQLKGLPSPIVLDCWRHIPELATIADDGTDTCSCLLA